MGILVKNINQVINKAYLRTKQDKTEINIFKSNLYRLLSSIDENETEEYHKNLIIEFLRQTYYKKDYFINTKGHNDLVIHNESKPSSSVGIIIEVKKPNNRTEMLSLSRRSSNDPKINVKAFHELLLYYLYERIILNNVEIKYLVATNVYEWFIFDARLFDRLFAQNKELIKQFNDFEEKRLSGVKTEFFYKNIAKPCVDKIIKSQDIEITYINLLDYKDIIYKENSLDSKLVRLYKIFSPQHLLKLPFPNDNNYLDKEFYHELLYIMGLKEVKKDGKKLIIREEGMKRNSGSIIENAINQLEILDKLEEMENPDLYGNNNKERLFNIAIELSLTWVNRILFLKLLESQLIIYNKSELSSEFFNYTKIKDYNALNELFFNVLAVEEEDRCDDIKKAFNKVPYLNSALFEPTELEKTTIFISNLDSKKVMPIYSSTILKDHQGKKLKGQINPIEYIFTFLNSYDFSSEGYEDIQDDKRILVNASVLGLIFEKINGYKDGSYFTPGYITMYISREMIRKIIIEKFNKKKNWKCKNFDELYNEIEKIDKIEANMIINNIKICDPAVGSGHFLVSALNELIVAKDELGILLDKNGRRIRNHNFTVENDELIITDEYGDLYVYNPNIKDNQNLQETIFHEKENIIENCLFGVDVNMNSVNICRLRLWIELLKNAYYDSNGKLETLPNIDINIKHGNSLLSKIPVSEDIRTMLSRPRKWTIDSYKEAISNYHNSKSKIDKKNIGKLIDKIKEEFHNYTIKPIAENERLLKLNRQLISITDQGRLFEMSNGEKSVWKNKVKMITDEISNIEEKMKKIEIEKEKLLKNSFEWRYEFPQVLDNEGNFIGFDLIIGNPPYINIQKFRNKPEQLAYKIQNYRTYDSYGDIYCLFFEKGLELTIDNGCLAYITSNKWMNSGYGKRLREFLLEYNPIQLVDLGSDIFDAATVDTSILFVEKKKVKEHKIHALVMSKKNKNIVEQLNNNSMLMMDLDENPWFIASESKVKLKRKIEEIGKPLELWNIEINYGIKTGLNNAFIIDNQTKNKICEEDPRSEEILYKIVRGKDINRYKYSWKGKWLLNTRYDMNIPQLYPAAYKYLLQFEPEAMNREDQGQDWWNLRACAYYKEFEKEKLVWTAVNSQYRFCLLPEKIYVNNSVFMITGDNIKYLCGIFNSKLMRTYLSFLFSQEDKYTYASKESIKTIPIPVLTEDNKEIVKTIEMLVEKIVIETKQECIISCEEEIDKLIYRLFDLSDNEIEMIEKNEL